jgi:hypothetical protein
MTLEPALVEQMREQFRGCLCLACLQALSAGAPVQRVTTPQMPDSFQTF